MSAEEILTFFYESVEYKKNKHGWQFKQDISFYKAKVLSYDFLDSNTGKIIFQKGSKLNQRLINEFSKKKINNLTIEESSLIGHYLASDIIDDKTGKIYYEAGFEVDEEQQDDKVRRCEPQPSIKHVHAPESKSTPEIWVAGASIVGGRSGCMATAAATAIIL